jgi:TolB-like protein
MSGDPDQDYFADGGGRRNNHCALPLQVPFCYRSEIVLHLQGKTVDIKQVAPMSWVFGMCSKAAYAKLLARFRLTGQLIEAASNTHLWADKFDGDLEDIFDPPR